jgi:Domain of unknown function (DUF3883)
MDFEKISWRQIMALCDALRASSSFDLATVRRWYNGEANNFEETIKFIADLGIISVSQNKIAISPQFEKCISDESAVRRYLIDLIFGKKANLKKYFGDFFARFEQQEGLYQFTPNLQERLRYSGVRNFLISLGVLEFDSRRNRYTAAIEISPYLLDQTRVLPYNDFVRNVRAAEELGLKAELAILDQERKLLKKLPALQKRIRHMSLENVRAGYDILSFEKRSGEEWREKYLEVKAVSPIDWHFYWSRNEMAKAKKFRDAYYLCLVPVSGPNDFNLSEVKLIPDPYKNIFQNRELWIQEIESISFYNKGSFS